MSVKQQIIHYLTQLPGWRTRRKIVIIESDDWGSIRMPSKEIYKKLLDDGFHVDRCPFSMYDSLERSEDLSVLFDVLLSVRDKNGKPAVVTANSVVANPDFERIKNSGFTEYYYEEVTNTFKKYKGCENSLGVLKQGINSMVWHPQFHGREHLNVIRWMKALQQKDDVTMLSFNQQHFGLSDKVTPKLKVRYMDALGNVGEASLEEEGKVIEEGTRLFEKLYGYKSKSFIAPCYTWRKEIESILAYNGLKYLQGIAFQQIPVQENPLKFKSCYHYMGEKNRFGQYYIVRNAFFEPYKGGAVDYVGECLNRINIAFQCHKPAIISSHRVNFIGTLDESHRDKNLGLLKEWLKKIIQKWPDVEFLTSDQLGDLIASKL